MKKIPRIAMSIETQFYYGRGILRGFAKYSFFHGPWAMYVVETNVRNKVSQMKSFDVDAIVMNDTVENMKLRSLKIPKVVLSGFYTPKFHYPNLVIDNNQQQLGYMAADYFLQRGSKNFAYCGYYAHEDLYWSVELCNYYAERIKEKGFNPYIFSPPRLKDRPTWYKDQTLIVDWLKSLPKPVAVLGCNDIRCRDIMEACKTARLNVPGDVAIMGIGNDNLICDFTVPPLSSIALDVEDAGFRAAQLLDNILKGQKMDGQLVTIQPQYIISRQSTDILAIEDSEVKKAIKFIEENAIKPICVDDVVDATTLSRRVLENRFRDLLKTSILEQVHSYRAGLIAKMLVETDLSISQITSKLGYDTPANFSRFFLKQKKMSPLAYRKKFSASSAKTTATG
jgi:LacI family transcriptional regulator